MKNKGMNQCLVFIGKHANPKKKERKKKDAYCMHEARMMRILCVCVCVLCINIKPIFVRVRIS